MSRSQTRFHLWKGKNKRLRALALTTLCLVSCVMFFLRQFAWAEGDLAAPAGDKNVVSSQPSAALQEIDKAKEEQRKFIEKINTMRGAEEITCRYNLDGSWTITDEKEGTVSLFDKDGKTLSIADADSGKITNFNSDGKIESITFASGEKKEYLYDEKGEFLEVKEYNNLDMKSTSGDLQATSQEIEAVPALISSSLATNTEEGDEGEKTIDKIEPNLSLIGQSNTILPEFKSEEESIPKIIIDNVISESHESPIFTKEALFNISNWLKTQVENIVNCATKALETVVNWFLPEADQPTAEAGEPVNQLTDEQANRQIERLAENAVLADILGGVITENTQGILQTSMYAIKEAAKKEGVDLVGAKLTYKDLQDIYPLFAIRYPLNIICHLTEGHYIVVTKADDVNVGYIDSKGIEQIISKEIFISQWSGNVLMDEDAMRYTLNAIRFSDDTLKQIRGSGLTARLYTFDDGTSLAANGFKTGTTGAGTVVLDVAVVCGDGGYSIKIYGNNSDSNKTYVEKISSAAEDSEISFYWKVSSEYGCDYLKFYIDGVEQDGKISGEADWKYKTYNLTAGEHVLRWEYEKDSSMSEGEDDGWVDNISIYENETTEPEKENNNAIVRTGDRVGVKYTGYLEDRSVFDSNQDSSGLFYFIVGLGDVIQGFDEAVVGLALGDKITVTIPPEKAYGLEGTHELAGKTLIFDIEVLDIATVVGDTPYTCSFDDGASLAANGFATGTTAGGSTALDANVVYGDGEYSMKLQGNSSDSSNAYAEKTFILGQDGKVDFYWKVSSEGGYDYLKFYIDNVEQSDKISGDGADWVYKTYALTAGTHTFKWSYEKDGSSSKGSDAGWVDEITVSENETEEPQEENNETVVKTSDYIGVKYTGYLEDGSVFDSNENSSGLFYFTVGSGNVIQGFDEAVVGLALGDKITVTVPPEKGYGTEEGSNELAGKTLIFDIQVLELNGRQVEIAGDTPYTCSFDDGTSPEENGFKVGSTGDGSVVAADNSNPLAGKTLIFDIQVMDINGSQAATEGGITYSCNFDDVISLEANGFITGAEGEGGVALDADVVHGSGGYSMKLQGNSSDSSNAYAEKTFILGQDGKVDFYWKVSSEGSYDYLKFYIDDVEQSDKISGDGADWAYKTYALTAGTHTLKWSYEKDGSVSEGSDAGWVDNITIYENAAEAPEENSDTIVQTGDYIGVKYKGSLEDGTVFDSNQDSSDLFYFTVGSGNVIQGFDEAVIGLSLEDKITVTIPPEKAYGLKDTEHPSYSMKLQGNSSDSSSAYAEKTFIFEQDSEVDFSWKVSSEANYDYLRFYIDGVEQDKISGKTDWAYKTYALTAGKHTLKWSYEKDGSSSDGSDAGWVDNISVYKSETQDIPEDFSWEDFFKDYMSDETENNNYDEFDWSKYLDELSTSDLNNGSSHSSWAPSSFSEVVMEGGLGGKQAKVFATPKVRMEATNNLYGYGPHLYAAAESLSFDDGNSIEENGFATGASGEGAVMLEEDVVSGGYSMKICGNNSQGSVTYAEKVLNLKEAAQIKFSWKVSSERGSDYLKFYIDGVEYDEISGEADWACETYDLAEGKHALRWVYEKNESVSNGEDSGWVDEISVSEAGAKEQGVEKGKTSSGDSGGESTGNSAGDSVDNSTGNSATSNAVASAGN